MAWTQIRLFSSITANHCVTFTRYPCHKPPYLGDHVGKSKQIKPKKKTFSDLVKNKRNKFWWQILKNNSGLLQVGSLLVLVLIVVRYYLVWENTPQTAFICRPVPKLTSVCEWEANCAAVCPTKVSVHPPGYRLISRVNFDNCICRNWEHNLFSWAVRDFYWIWAAHTFQRLYNLFDHLTVCFPDLSN